MNTERDKMLDLLANRPNYGVHQLVKSYAVGEVVRRHIVGMLLVWLQISCTSSSANLRNKLSVVELASRVRMFVYNEHFVGVIALPSHDMVC